MLRVSSPRRQALGLAAALLMSAPGAAAERDAWHAVTTFTSTVSPQNLLLENRVLFMAFVGSMASWLRPPQAAQGLYLLPSVELTRAESRLMEARTFTYNGSVRLGVDLGYRLRRGNVELASGLGLRQDWGFNVLGATGASLRAIELERGAVPVALTLNVLHVSLFF